MKLAVLIFTLSFVAVASPVEAVKLWKWVDKDGKVTYSETPPPSSSFKAEKKQIDPDRNVIDAYVPGPAPASSSSPAATMDIGGGQATPPQRDRRREIAAGAGAAAATAPPPPPPPPPPPVSPPPGGH
jgi:hypothetical protein